MAPEPINMETTLKDGETQKQLGREIREMISALIHRLSDLQHVEKQPAVSSHSHRHYRRHHHNGDDQEDEGGMRIIRLAGSNTGAAVRGVLEDNSSSCGENEVLDTYASSNFQAINNSVMIGGSYSTNDPGVHMEIVSDYYDPAAGVHGYSKQPRNKVKGKKKDKESEHSD